MSINGAFCVILLYLGCFEASSADWVKNVTKHIVKDSEFNHVKFMTQLGEDEILESSVIEEFFVELMQGLPVVRINFGENFELPRNSVLDLTMPMLNSIDTSATLFCIVIESQDSLTNPMTKTFIDAVMEMATYHYNPKYLMLSNDQKASVSVEELLEYAWTKKMLDFTIVELVETKLERKSILIESPIVEPIIHRLNPFEQKYTAGRWQLNENELFPAKDSNLWGYEVNVATRLHWPFVVSNVDDDHYLDADDLPLGAVMDVVSTLLSSLNASAMFTDSFADEPFGTPESELLGALYALMDSSDIDVVTILLPPSPNSWSNSQRTTTILSNEFCAAVPIIERSEFVIPPNLLVPYIPCFTIIFVVWIAMRVLRYNSYCWRPFNIARVIFGVSVAQQPRGNVERIMFCLMFTVCATYSSDIYASITDITLTKTGQVPFETLEQLNNSGLVPSVQRYDFERTESLFDGPLKGLRNQNVPVKVQNTDACLGDIYYDGNATCFMDQETSKYIIQLNHDTQRDNVKMAKPCFWTESWGIVLAKRSPYRPRLDKLIERFRDVGIIQKCFDDALDTITVEIRRKEKEESEMDTNDSQSSEGRVQKEENMSPLCKQLLAIATVSYTLSLLVFCGEIIFYRISMCKKSKVLPFRQFRGPNKNRKKWKIVGIWSNK